ncbi:MAG: translation initiation factor IF-2 [Patescibacteria group bacterium]
MSIRPPIVAVLGHIDHGKSTLLDYIRQSAVVAGEAGGITQRLGAYEVEVATEKEPNIKKKITFLDTPGHEAFSLMRERGAAVADIGVLVVSAEDGVKAQTLEAWRAITTAGLQPLVAFTKIDKPSANLDKAKQSLAENNILVEGYGGQIANVALSAKTGAGIQEFIDLILLMADVAELTSDPAAPAEGLVLEANVDARAGTTATVIVKNGTLGQRDFIVSGQHMFRLRKLTDFTGHEREAIPPSAPAVILGWNELPKIGAGFRAFADKKAADSFLASQPTASATKREETAQSDAAQPNLPLIIKAELAGSLEAIEKEIVKLTTTDVKIKIIGRGVGHINASDLKLASSAPGTTIVGFDVKIDKTAEEVMEKYQVPVKIFSVIYHLNEWLTEEVARRKPKQAVETALGQARVLKIFGEDRGKQIVGGTVLEGQLRASGTIKIMRRQEEIGQGKITSLESQKSKVKEVATGAQFGALIDTAIDLAPSDVLLCFEREEK